MARFFRYIEVYLVVEKYFEIQVWICAKSFRRFCFLGNNLIQFSLIYIVIKSNGFFHAIVLISKKNFEHESVLKLKVQETHFLKFVFFLHPKFLGSTVKTACRTIFIKEKCMKIFSHTLRA